MCSIEVNLEEANSMSYVAVTSPAEHHKEVSLVSANKDNKVIKFIET
jgi:hypothetical protein